MAVPKINRSTTMLRWLDAFTDYLSHQVGSRNIPLAYVVRAEEAVPAAVPALAQNRPYSTTHGSVETELVARASQTHPKFQEDNKHVYILISEAIRGSPFLH